MGVRFSRPRVGGKPPAQCDRYIKMIRTIFDGGFRWEPIRRDVTEINSGTEITVLAHAFIDSGEKIESFNTFLKKELNGVEPNPHQKAAMDLAAEWDTALSSAQALKQELIDKTTAARDSDKTVNGAFNVQYVRNNRFDRGREEWVAVIYINGVIKVELFYGFTNQVGVKLYAWAWMGGHPDIGNCFTTAAALMKTMPGRAVNLIELSN